MTASFEGFPRPLDRNALRPGRWFVAAEGLRPVLCFATEVMEGEDVLALTFAATRPEVVDFAVVGLSQLPSPFASVEDEIVFTPGLSESRPMLTAPARRAFRSGSLLRLRSGDLGVGFATQARGELVIVSLVSGHRAEGFDLVFDRWSLWLRRAQAQTLVGHFKPIANLTQERRRV